MQIVSRDFHEMREIFNSTVRGKLQISYNSDERITLRLVSEDDSKEDTLVNLDRNETWALIQFIRNRIKW